MANTEFTGGHGQPSIDRNEHDDKNMGVKKVALIGYKSANDTYYRLATEESADNPGVYGLVTVSANGYDKEWARDVRFDPNDSAPEYIGTHMSEYDASTSATDWYITKFTRSSGSATRIQRRRGSWDNRATLF